MSQWGAICLPASKASNKTYWSVSNKCSRIRRQRLASTLYLDFLVNHPKVCQIVLGNVDLQDHLWWKIQEKLHAKVLHGIVSTFLALVAKMDHRTKQFACSCVCAQDSRAYQASIHVQGCPWACIANPCANLSVSAHWLLTAILSRNAGAT